MGVAVGGEDGVTDAFELTPAESIRYIGTRLRDREVDVLIIEEFRLYPWMATTQSYSDFPTVQLIGALKLLHATNGCVDWGEQVVAAAELVMQSATIKDPTRKILRGRKIKSVAKQKRAGGHAADAELHLWHWALRR